MSGTKISALPAAGALAGTEPVPIVQGGATVQTTTLAIANKAQTLAGTPTAPTPALSDNSTRLATTAFVQALAAGINPAMSVEAATTAAGDTAALTYNNGVAGIGATFTGAINTAVTIDGYTFTATGQRLLVKNDTQAPSGAFNGIYSLTQLQTGLLPPIFTRAANYDTPSDINNSGLIPVINGTANAVTTWVLTSIVNVVGTDPLTFTGFAATPITGANPTAVVGTTAVNGASSHFMRADGAPPLAAGNTFAGPRSLVYKIGQVTTQQSHTGDTAETLLGSIKIPANMLGANGSITINGILSRNGSGANAVTYRVRYGSANDLTGTNTETVAIGTAQLNAQLGSLLFTNRNATNSQVWSSLITSNAPPPSTIDTTADTWVVISGQLTNAGDTISLEFLQLLFNPAGGN